MRYVKAHSFSVDFCYETSHRSSGQCTDTQIQVANASKDAHSSVFLEHLNYPLHLYVTHDQIAQIDAVLLQIMQLSNRSLAKGDLAKCN